MLLGALVAATPAAAQPVPGPPAVIDGPSQDLVGLSGMAIARDGTGAVVYLKNVAGVPHVFLSRLVAGGFQTPTEIDVPLAGISSQPVIAASNGGLVLVAFVNGGELYVVDVASTSSQPTAPIPLYAQVGDPSIAITTLGKAYVAFTASTAGGFDVRAAYYYQGQWALEQTPLEVSPSDNAGTGPGRPDVAVAGDGVAIVAWGEAGHIYTRRVWGTQPSVTYEMADPPALGGYNEVSADTPSVASGGDSSYADVIFSEQLSNGVLTQSRVLMNRLHGSVFDGVTQPDGLSTPGVTGADQPQIAMTEYGHGYATSERTPTHELYAMQLGDNGTSAGLVRVDSLQNATAPAAVPAAAGLFSNVIAWQHDPGGAGQAEIRIRYADSRAVLGPETVVSSPGIGPTDATRGLAAGGDVNGDAVVAWVQGSGSSTQIIARQLYQEPGGFGALPSFQYSRVARPVLAWSTPNEAWGPVTYAVSLDGAPIGQTAATSMIVPAALTDGPHTWQVTATNAAGQQSNTSIATVWVDTVPPAVSLTISGIRRAGSYLHAYVADTDSPPPEPGSAASGVAQVLIDWGDGSSYVIAHGKFHAYTRPGRYVVRVTVTDRAGNATTVAQVLKIAAKPKPKPKPKPKRKPRRGPRR
jgi:PKD domain-containing protein